MGLKLEYVFVGIDLLYDYFAYGNLELLTSKSESKVLFFVFCESIVVSIAFEPDFRVYAQKLL
jgi:hypothetical protein